jgi:hypothetical protein
MLTRKARWLKRYGVSALSPCRHPLAREVMCIEVSGREEPRGGIRGVVKTPAGEVLNKYQSKLFD